MSRSDSAGRAKFVLERSPTRWVPNGLFGAEVLSEAVGNVFDMEENGGVLEHSDTEIVDEVNSVLGYVTDGEDNVRSVNQGDHLKG